MEPTAEGIKDNLVQARSIKLVFKDVGDFIIGSSQPRMLYTLEFTLIM